jgi:tetratricopeptide (TPR) repeat protein
MAAETLAHLGILFFRLERPAEALACLHTALSLDPNHAEALVTYAALFAGNKDVLIACMARLIATNQLPDERALLVKAFCARTGLPEAQLARQIQRRAQADAPSKPLLTATSSKADEFVKALKDAKEPLVPQLLDVGELA